MTGLDAEFGDGPQQGVGRGNVDRLHIRAAAHQLARPPAAPIQEHRHGAADAAPVERQLLIVEQVLQGRQALALDGVRNLIRQGRRRGAGADTVLERIRLGESDVFGQPQCGPEVRLRLAGKADDEIRRQGDIGPRAAQAVHQPPVSVARVAAVHGGQHAVRPRLHRQVQIRHKLGHVPVRRDQFVVHVGGVRRGVADAVHSLDSRHRPDQTPQSPFAPVRRCPVVTIDVLAEQGDFPHAGGGQAAGLGQNIGHGTRVLGPACIRHHAESAELVAALLHGEEGGGGLDAPG